MFEAVRKHGGQGAGDSKSEEAKCWEADLEVDRRELQRGSGFGEFLPRHFCARKCVVDE